METTLKQRNVISVYYSTETAYFIGPKTWDTLHNGCKDATQKQPLEVFYKKGCSYKFHKICRKTLWTTASRHLLQKFQKQS